VQQSRGDGADMQPVGPVFAGTPRKVVVIGAGVSGCACAATLASAGVRVTVVNNALDSVGQPGYGPVVTAGGWERVAEVMDAMPTTLRDAWLDASVASDTEAPFFCVDRRRLSIETKRALEAIPGLEFRQGYVISLRTEREGEYESGAFVGCSSEGEVTRPARVVVGTAFGEEIGADAVVVAVGLSLGGRIDIGDGVLAGMRCGETSADGLRVSLEGMGVMFREVTVEVGQRFSRGKYIGSTGGVSADAWGPERGRGEWASGVVPLRTALRRAQSRTHGPESREVRPEERALAWSADYPPAPYWSEELAADTISVSETELGGVVPVVSPDGVTTGEVYVTRESMARGGVVQDECVEPGCRGTAIASRLGYNVVGLVTTNTGPMGRVAAEAGPAGAIWLAGQAGGAAGYLESVASGLEVGHAVAAALGAHDGANGAVTPQRAR
jgi:tRNA U34 5-carboxymethylaminomethyl modifying enzyme MnmG/GidA